MSTQAGILIHIDLKGSCPQGQRAGSTATRQFYEYLAAELRIRAEKFGFQFIKTIGDASLFFGEGPGQLAEFCVELFTRNPVPDQFGFQAVLRPAAWFGLFELTEDGNGKIIDSTGPDTNKLFRFEKHGEAGKFLVHGTIGDHIRQQFPALGITELPAQFATLASFENEGPVRYFLLVPPRRSDGKDVRLPDAYLKQRDELKKKVQTIPVLGGIFPPIPMKENFIELSLDLQSGIRLNFDYSRRLSLRGEKEKEDDRATEMSYRAAHDSTRDNTFAVDELFDQFSHGVIFGLPGAGKTTILHHFIWRALEADPDQLVLLLRCGDLLRENFPTASEVPDNPWPLLVASFLFPGKRRTKFKPEEKDLIPTVAEEFRLAWAQNRVLLLIDALDETPDAGLKETIKQITYRLYQSFSTATIADGQSQNRFFLTARRGEQATLKLDKIPVLHVNPLTLLQLYTVAEHLYGGKNELWNTFVASASGDRAVEKIGGTPLTAMLLACYFRVHGSFEHRFAVYDLLVKFTLHGVWEKLRNAKGRLQWQSPEDFFHDVAGDDFLNKHRETRLRYQALSDVCFSTLHHPKESTPERHLSQDTLEIHFEAVLKAGGGKRLSREAALAKAKSWIRQLHKDHLLLDAGPRQFVFVHSTVMEFLAARHLAGLASARKQFATEVTAIARNRKMDSIETLPILCGARLKTGYKVLAFVLETVPDWLPEVNLPCRCLAEIEDVEERQLERLGNKDAIKRKEIEFSEGTQSRKTAYLRLKNILMMDEAKRLQSLVSAYTNVLPLRRHRFLHQYVPTGWTEGPSDLVKARREWLSCVVGSVIANALHTLEFHEIIERSAASQPGLVLTLDKCGDPEDKNFSYFQKLMGPELAGFYGSSNFRHAEMVRCLAVSRNGHYAVSGSDDKTLKLWEVESGRELRSFSGHQGYVLACAFSPDGCTLLSAAGDNTLKLWEVESGRELRSFAGHKSWIRACAFSPDGRTLLSGSDDNTLKLWEVESGRELRSLAGHKRSIQACVFAPDGRTLVSGADDNTLKLWEVESGRELRSFAGHQGSVCACAFAPDGRNLLSGSRDNTLKLWDVEGGGELRSFSGHQNSVQACAFAPDGRTLLSGSRDNTLKLWEVESGLELRSFAGHKNSVWACAFVPEGRTLLSGSRDNSLKLWDVGSGRELRSFAGHQGSVWACAFAPDGRTLLSGSNDHMLKLWEVGSGRELRSFTGHKDWIRACAFAPDGRTLLSGSTDHTLKLWEVESGRELRSFAGHKGSVQACSFAPDGHTLVSGSGDHTLKLWGVEIGRELRSFAGHQGSVQACSFAPDGHTLLSGSGDHTLKLWEVKNGRELRSFAGHKDSVQTCAFAPDGRTVLSGSDDHTLKLWEVERERELRSFIGHQSFVWACTFAPDGRTLLSGSADKTLKLWDTQTGCELFSITLPWAPRQLSISPKSPHLVATANPNGTLTLFDLSRHLPR